MRFDILTLFPEIINCFSSCSLLKKASDNGLVKINAVNIRDFSQNKHKKTDDYPYGGGSGLIMTPQPIYDAWQDTVKSFEKKPHLIFVSPQGPVLNQKKLQDLAELGHMGILCGHYEGIDERIIDEIVDEEISIGDYILMGGEIAAMAIVEGVSRLVPGVLHNPQSTEDESHSGSLLEYPQYTRPECWMERKVPEILLSGHHKNIDNWRKNMSIERTRQKRPDLLDKYIKSGGVSDVKD